MAASEVSKEGGSGKSLLSGLQRTKPFGEVLCLRSNLIIFQTISRGRDVGGGKEILNTKDAKGKPLEKDLRRKTPRKVH